MKSETTVRPGQIGVIAGALAIMALVLIVYSPILPGQFVMDDERLIGADNPLVNGNLTLHSLWFGTDFTLATFGWWLERLAFGNDPLGYHLVDLALHAIACLLLWRVLAQLKIPGAWLAGALFAVHPVCVNSVARVAEMKNTLSLPFFLLSLSAYLRYEVVALYPAERTAVDKSSSGRSGVLWFTVSLVAFVLAMLAKTTAVMLPVILLFCAAWQRRRIALKDLVHTAPYFLLSLVFGLMSVWFQKYQALPSTSLSLVPETFWQRLASSGDVIWFYLGKAFVPVNLSVAYSPIQVTTNSWTSCLPLLSLGLGLAICWRFRLTWGRHMLFALGCFAAILFPALGFFDAQYQTMWSVSDHLQYGSLPALMALAAAAIAICLRRFFLPIAAATLLIILSILSFQRAQVFTSEENLVKDTLKKNPASWAAHNDMGTILAERNDYVGAIREFTLSLQGHPDNVEELMNLAHALSLAGQYDAADTQFQKALVINPGAGQLHKAYAEALYLQGNKPEALRQLRWASTLQPDAQTELELASWFFSAGDTREAVNAFNRVLVLDPDNLTALNDLAWILSTSPDLSLRNGSVAVRDAERACHLTSYKQPEMLSNLSVAQADAGDFSNAIVTAQMAIKIAAASGDNRVVSADEQFLRLYQAQKPILVK